MRRTSIAIVLACSVVGCARSPQAPPAASTTELRVHTDADLAKRLEAWRAEAGVPGLGAAVLRGDDLAIAVAGTRRVDQATPLATTDAFHLGSDTKAITASVVARLVDRGVLRWNETLS